MENAQVVESLRGLNLRELETLAARAGIPFATLYSIARRGDSANPRMATLDKLKTALQAGKGQ